jgi:cytochrome c oxidase assembly factor CtaG
VAAAVASPLAELSEDLFAAHMAQHVVIGDLAALLIALGITGPVVQPLLRVRVLRHVRTIAHPAIALPLWLANLYAWHIPALYQATLGHEAIHALEHALFIACGTNMWLALLGPFPAPAWFGNAARLGYVLIVRFAGAILGNVFIWSGTVFYPRYESGEAAHGVSALRDQGLAGSVMMIESSILTVALIGWLLLRAFKQGEERQQLLELADRLGVELTEERARRAVQAGRADQLRRRIEQTART